MNLSHHHKFNRATIFLSLSSTFWRRNTLSVMAVVSLVALTSCTTRGALSYITPDGENKTACETEYSWAPDVDRYAVEYVLSYCARQAVEQGNIVTDEALLNNDLAIPAPPNGKSWTFELAKRLHDDSKLSDKEFGYIVAFIDVSKK